MTAALRQLAALIRAYIYAWCVSWHHAVLSIAVAVAYLAVINQSFVVTLTRRVVVGVYTKDADIGRRIREDLTGKGLGVVAYDTPAAMWAALSNGLLAAGMELATNTPSAAVRFGGCNPLMDREMANVLLEMTARLATHTGSRYQLSLQGNSYVPDRTRAFVTANLVPFLLLSLVIVNCGIVQVMAVENKSMCGFLLTPVPRAVLYAAQLGSGVIVSLAVFLLAYAVCIPLAGVPVPAAPVRWLALCLFQLVCTGAVYLYIALAMRRYIPFAQFSIVSITLFIFAGGGVTPFEVMPQWERVFASCTPALYMIRSMRAVMLGTEAVRLNDLAVLAMWGIAGSVLAHQRLRRMVVSG